MDTYLSDPDSGFWDKYRAKLTIVGIFLVSLIFGLWSLGSGKNLDVDRPAVKEMVNAQRVWAMVRYQDLGMFRIEGARFNVPVGYIHSQKDVFYESILPSYLLMPIYTLFSFDLGKIAYFYVILGAITSVMVFAVAKMMFGFWQGVFAAIFYSTTATVWLNNIVPMHSSFSPLIVMIVLFFLIRIVSGKNGYKNWTLLTFFTALSIQFQAINILWIIAVPLVLVLFRYQGMLNWRKIICAKFVFLTTLSLLFLAEITNSFVQTKAWIGYFPSVFVLNLKDIVVDFFVATGKNILFYFSSGSSVGVNMMWVLGVGMLIFMVLRWVFWRRSDQSLVRSEKILFAILIVMMIGSYLNYLAYFKNQLEYVAVVRSFGFYFPVLAIFMASYVSVDRLNKRRVMTVIMVFLIIINVFYSIKSNTKNEDGLSGYAEKQAVVRSVIDLANKKNYAIEIDSDLFDPATYVYLADSEGLRLPVQINGSKVVRNLLFQQGNSILSSVQIGNDTVVIKSVRNQVLSQSNEAETRLLVTDTNIESEIEQKRIGRFRIFVMK